MTQLVEGIIYDKFDVIEVNIKNEICETNNASIKVITEIPLRVVVNGEEYVSLLSLNQYQEELALGFLYSEGVINSIGDVKSLYYNVESSTVEVDLLETIETGYKGSLRSITSGGGKCFTHIDSENKDKYNKIPIEHLHSGVYIIKRMKSFLDESKIFVEIGGVHSVLLDNDKYQLLTEDIGRHNALDKITGILLKNDKMDLIAESVLYLSGRISSEMITKVIRLGVPVIVSRSTPTATAIKLAEEYNVTLLGYVRGNKGSIYTVPQRMEL